MNKKEGYNNILYYIKSENAGYYWISSPSVENYNGYNFQLAINKYGGIVMNHFGDKSGALRPVVCINENQKLDVKE